MNAMKKMIGLSALGLALVLTGCVESEVEKQAKEGAEISKKMGDDSRQVPRVVLTPDKLQPQKADWGK